MKHLVVLTLLFCSLGVMAGEMTLTVPVDPTAISLESAGGYTMVTGEGMRLSSTIGAPSLPVLTARFALPTGCSASDIEVVDASYTQVRALCTVMPAGPAVPLSVDEPVYPVTPDENIYSSSEFFPKAAIEFRGSSVISGIPVAYADVSPVRWNPASGELEVLSSLTVTVTYGTDASASTISRRSLQSEQRAMAVVAGSVVNPEQVSGSGASIVPSRELEYGEYVIVTHPNYEAQAQELADWKTAKGIPTRVFTTTYIQALYNCYDLAQEIRAFLTDCIDEGAEFVLIYGDDNMIAGRDAKIYYSSYVEYPPVDLYWSDINDTAPGADRWDSSGNHVWGEYGSDAVDYHPDLWTGRASVNSASEAWLFNDKVFTYEAVPGSDYFETAPREMRVGYTTELLWGSPYYCYGSAGAELISPMVPSGWEEEKCYDSGGNNSVSITQSMINARPHHVYHASHGSRTSFSLPGGSYTTSHMMSLTNISTGGLPAIWNSISCLIGHLDGYECMGDAWLASPNGGGFGAFNARYGWGNPSSPGYGASEILSRYFYDVMWNDDQYRLGVAHQMGNDEMCPPSDAVLDWCVKEYNLFGDPEMPMWYNDETAALSVTHPGVVYGAGNITVTVTAGGSAVSGATVCIQKGAWQTGEVYEVGTTNSGGSVTLAASPSTGGTIDIVVTARDHVPYMGTITVSLTGIEEGSGGIGTVDAMGSVYPSPAFSSVTIPFSTAAAGMTSIMVFDVTGRVVTTLAAEEMSSGSHSLVWDLQDDGGASVPSGIYHVMMRTADWSGVSNLVVTR